MKTLFVLFITFSTFLFSCESKTEKGNESAYSDFEVLIDTIQVDPGNEILMAGAEIRNPGVSKDKKWFYSWDQKNFALEIVDLENYKLEEKVYFEQEGPKGIGPNYFYSVDPFPNKQFGFENYESYRIYDLNGNLIKKVNFDAEWINADLEEVESFELSAVNENGTVLAGNHFTFNGFKAIMYLLDVEAEKVTNIQLPEFEKLKNYKIVLRRNGTYLTSVDSNVFIEFLGDSILISNDAFNDIYFYNDKTKELGHRTFNHKIVPVGRQNTYKNESESEEEIIQIIKEMNAEISFTRFFWDELNQKYYRFANKAIYLEDQEPKWKVFMLVYSKALNLIGEKELMTFDDYANPLFVKNGKVHFHLNIEDELGFIRIGLKN